MGQAKELVDRVWQALEAQDLDGFAELVRPDTEIRQGGVTVRGPEQIRAFMESFLVAFPDMRHEIVAWIESGETVALEIRAAGTHTGFLRSPNGEIPPSGKRVTLESCDYLTVQDGKLKSWHVYMDQLAFLSQLGLMPAPAAA